MKSLARFLMMALLIAGALPTRAGTWTVNPGESIQAAIDSASDGDTINVNAGTYDETLTIQKSVHLYGTDATLTYTDNTAPREQLVMLGWNTGGDLTGGATIQGFDLVGAAGLYDDNDLIKLRANGTAANPITIQNNTLQGDGASGYKGIESSYDAGYVTLKDNEFRDLFHGAWFNVLTDSTIEGNLFDNAVYSGLAICTGATGATHHITLTDNVISNSGLTGDSSYPTYTVGLHLGSTISDLTATGNDITGSQTYGVVFHDRGSTDLTNVQFSGNNIHNSVSGRGMLNETTTLVDAKGNWWGDATGPYDDKSLPNTPDYNNPDGLGDDVSAYVDYQDWLDASVSTTATPIPEPTGLGLLGLTLLGLRRRRRS